MHGISVTEVASQKRNIATIATAVIGLVATGPAADAGKFPLDKPVNITNLPAAIALAGATGTLKGALEAIADQVRCPIIVVRVAPGADAEATALKVIGTDAAGVKTGMQALLAAEAQTGLRPRIIGAPGLDGEAVKTQLAIVARKLRAMAYGRADGASIDDVIEGRDAFTQRELMLIHPDFLAPVGVLGATGTSFAVARALGLRARIDQEMGWNKTLSNVPVAGVVGLTSDIGFDLQDPDSDAAQLNAAHVTTMVRINGALRFWGNRTCADADSDFVFESATRTAQILADTMANGLIEYIDKPLTPSLARDIVEDINEKFRKLSRAGFLLGARAYFDPDKNPTEDLKLGKLKISYVYTPTPPLEDLGLLQEISDEYLADFAQLVASA
ncbi:phage tail sheath subtilisin-like domain-containing protein [Sphingomonas sp. QA11]|uniref:phage tail sheath subtilisin-like domain-containing protein n=1 Tax=Sphingomonas sp. QA11 TaxID=2950605 RepID=UPI00234A9983|nr:phage tail sheath subtilisin-like domain-containing protein [Sphingomonas sp. QA11]WCM29202.1 phage tail sheath subtilisin-like domain-containing protein [Sphingomonas sp. QA11]